MYSNRMYAISKYGKNITNMKGGKRMADERLPLFVGVDTIKRDLGVSRSKAYEIIKELNAQMKVKNPGALVVNGKVNRIWYEEACLLTGAH